MTISQTASKTRKPRATRQSKGRPEIVPAIIAGPPSETPAPALEAPPAAAARKGKIAILIDLMRRPEGARIADLMEATGWQAHSVRGAMSGAIKRNLGLAVRSEKVDGARVYRMSEEAAQ